MSVLNAWDGKTCSVGRQRKKLSFHIVSRQKPLLVLWYLDNILRRIHWNCRAIHISIKAFNKEWFKFTAIFLAARGSFKEASFSPPRPTHFPKAPQTLHWTFGCVWRSRRHTKFAARNQIQKPTSQRLLFCFTFFRGNHKLRKPAIKTWPAVCSPSTNKIRTSRVMQQWIQALPILFSFDPTGAGNDIVSDLTSANGKVRVGWGFLCIAQNDHQLNPENLFKDTRTSWRRRRLTPSARSNVSDNLLFTQLGDRNVRLCFQQQEANSGVTRTFLSLYHEHDAILLLKCVLK